MYQSSEDKLTVHLRGDDPPIVEASGELDFYNKQKLASVAEGLFAQEMYSFVLDMSQVDFADSAGLGLLILIQRRAETHGGKISALFHPRVAKTLKMMGLTTFFHIFGTREEALHHLASRD